MLHPTEPRPDAPVPGFDALFTRTFPLARWTAKQVLYDAVEAEDAAAMALVAAYRRWSLVSTLNVHQQDAWVRSAARLVAKAMSKPLAGQARRFGRLVPFDPARHASADPGPSLGGFERDGLDAALDALTPAQRDAVLARYVVGLSTREAAAALGVPETTVAMRSHHGLARLRTLLSA